MVDFLMISTRSTKRGSIEIYPKFIIKKPADLMIRGSDFYAIWLEDKKLWSTDEQDALQLIDRCLDEYAAANKHRYNADVQVLHMWDSESGMIDTWHKYCQKQMRDSFHNIDEQLVFENTATDRHTYATKKLPYALMKGDISSYDALMSVLYTPEERHKIEWAIGAIVTGASKHIQKFMVLYGSAGTGKSTVINIIQHLFEGYWSAFDSKALGSSNAQFALESFKSNPLVAIQHDGDLSKIEDNTRLNSVVSHEVMTVNEKFKSAFASKFQCFLIMGTNKPVKITDSKSGLIRRLIDVSPSGATIPKKEYDKLVKNVLFELGAIADYCKNVYLTSPAHYDGYIPMAMMGASNDFYNFITELYFLNRKEDCVTLKSSWEFYTTYCSETKVPFPHSQRVFKEELKSYFKEYHDRFTLPDGTRLRSYYIGFRHDRIEQPKVPYPVDPEKQVTVSKPLELNKTKSLLDDLLSNCKAQYASANETPTKAWDLVRTSLKTITTSKLHYVKPPESHIVIDFDLIDEYGNKSLDLNMKAASLWPSTYAELSKGGSGIHLHYNYSGDTSKLSSVYSDHIEVKVFTGNSSLRRKLSKCNDIPVATISSGLVLKGEKMLNLDGVKNEKILRSLLIKALGKGIHPGTKSNMDFIKMKLDEYYASGCYYDVSDLTNDVIAFAASSSNQSQYCLKLIDELQFRSESASDNVTDGGLDDRSIVFFDIEVFPNLVVVCWKRSGDNQPVNKFINPTSKDIELLIHNRLIGFNCRRYDNHILYGLLMGYSIDQIYGLSQDIISNKPNVLFGEAYNLSYTDVYDFASAGNKKSLKKFEIELGILHKELNLPWDKPVDESLWMTVVDYCKNDVVATEIVFNYLKGDWVARQILADIAGMTVNDTTNSLTTRIIFGKDKKPAGLNWRDLSQPVRWTEDCITKYGEDKKYRIFDDKGNPTYQDYIPHTNQKLKPGYSIMPFFPGYEHKFGKSTYLGYDVGEGGAVIAEPGLYADVDLFDIASQHPTSMEQEVLLGPIYTKRWSELKLSRVLIKHGKYDQVKLLLDGKLAKYLEDDTYTPTDLSNGLKTAINSGYGLTAAHFPNAFRDPRNNDNIVAKRGALFMLRLLTEVRSRGFQVVHIKTDSIKIPNATSEIIDFINKFGLEYGYIFEHEATYSRFGLVNDAVYIAKYKTGKHAGEWTATGTQFAVPYVFKTLFSNEPIVFDDLCETKSATTGLYLDFNEDIKVDVSEYEDIRDYRLAVLNGNPPKSITKKFASAVERFSYLSNDELDDLISEGHKYMFVGKVGRFCPIKPGLGGGSLFRTGDAKKGLGHKFYSAGGAKDYRWMEAVVCTTLKLENNIDLSYHQSLVDEAKAALSSYGDIEWFINGDSVETQSKTYDLKADYVWEDDSAGMETLIKSSLPCGATKYQSCQDCEYFLNPNDPYVCVKGYETIPF